MEREHEGHLLDVPFLGLTADHVMVHRLEPDVEAPPRPWACRPCRSRPAAAKAQIRAIATSPAARAGPCAALRKLAAAVSPRARVLRGGSELEIPSESVVRGDLLLLRDGEIVQADGVVGAQASLSLDESQLTGESEPQPKQPGDPVFAGSVVLGGQGVAEVTQTGPRTRYGRIAELVAKAVLSPTPLQRKTSQLVQRLGAVALLLAIAMALYSLLRGEGIRRGLPAGLSPGSG